MPIIQHYEKLGMVREVDSSRPKEEVVQAVAGVMASAFDQDRGDGI